MGDAVAVRDTKNTTQTKQVVRRTATPNVDVYENEDNVFVVADVPGVAREAIDVRVEHDTLTLETARAPGRRRGPRPRARVCLCGLRSELSNSGRHRRVQCDRRSETGHACRAPTQSGGIQAAQSARGRELKPRRARRRRTLRGPALEEPWKTMSLCTP